MENTNPEINAIIERATAQLAARRNQPVVFKLNVAAAVSLVSQLQLALRHPANVGPTSASVRQLVRDLIDLLDPERRDVYELLMMGFDARFDQAAQAHDATFQDIIGCRNCEAVTAVVDGKCATCGEEICLICGCTESAACPGGCDWTRENVCSECDPPRT